MRGGRSLLLLLVVALGLGAYIYFVESKRDVTETEKKDKIFTAESDKIEEIEVRAAGGDVTTLKKAGDKWQVVAPVKTDADDATVTPLVNALATTEITRVLDETPSDVAPFGLAPARYSVTFKTSGDAAPHQLNIGEKTPTGSDVYARVEGQTRVLLIPSFAGESLNRTTFDLRDKTALKFSRDDADAITIEPASGPTVSLARKQSEWRLTAPIDARADFSQVDGMVGRVAQAQIKSVELEGTEPTPAQLKTFGLDKPQLRVTIGAGSTRATLAVGGKKDDAALYARDLSRPVVFTVETSLLTDLEKKPEDLRAKDIFTTQSYNATGLDITHAGSSFSFAKSAGAPAADASASPTDVWKQTRPSAKDVNATAMTDLINTIASLHAEKFEDKAPASGDDLIVVLRSGDAAKPTEEQVTLRKTGTTAYAIHAGDPGAAIVPVADFDKAVEQLKALTTAK